MAIKRTSHAVYDTKYHLVWAPKYRRWIVRADIRQRAAELFRAIAEDFGCVLGGLGEVPPIDMPSSAEGQVVSEQGVVCGAHLPEEAPPFGRGVSLALSRMDTVPTSSSIQFSIH